MKNVIINASDKGGDAKSSNTSFLCDAFNHLGINYTAIDADKVNRTLSQMNPSAKKASINSEDDLDKLFGEASAAEHDVIIIDMPGSAGKAITDYISGISYEFLEETGLRLILVLHVVNDIRCFAGLLPWVEPFAGKAEFVAMLNERDGKFELEKFEVGKTLSELVEGRQITVPKLQNKTYEYWVGNPALLEQFIDPQSSINKKLQLNPYERQRFVMARKAFLESLQPHLEFLIGTSAGKNGAGSKTKPPRS